MPGGAYVFLCKPWVDWVSDGRPQSAMHDQSRAKQDVVAVAEVQSE